jgi:hypothetical protein
MAARAGHGLRHARAAGGIVRRGTPTISEQIVALQAMTVPALVAEYARVYGRPPHVKANRIWLWRRVAYRIQELALGGLADDARARLEELMADVVVPRAKTEVPAPKGPRGKHALPAGMTLTREWHGEQVTVRVTTTGFEWDGKPYRSLSAVAQAITGQHWSGNLFFGLKSRSKRG